MDKDTTSPADPVTPSAGNFCQTHRQGGIESSTVSRKPCDVCGAQPTKSGFCVSTKPLTPSTQIDKLLQQHYCRFNDGPQKCDCFIAGAEDMYSSLQKERDSYKEKLAELEKEQITIMEEQTATNLRYLEETRKRDEKLKVAMEALEEIDNNFMCAASTKALRRIRSLSPGPR